MIGIGEVIVVIAILFYSCLAVLLLTVAVKRSYKSITKVKKPDLKLIDGGKKEDKYDEGW